MRAIWLMPLPKVPVASQLVGSVSGNVLPARFHALVCNCFVLKSYLPTTMYTLTVLALYGRKSKSDQNVLPPPAAASVW